MFNNKLLLFLLFVFILSVPAASAHEDIIGDINAYDNQTKFMASESPEIGDFTDLNEEISNIATGGNFTLKKDYMYSANDSTNINGIKITKDNIIIDGNGHTIDGAGQTRIFDIVSNNVTLKNINFVNGHSNENGGAISASYKLNILNSTFNNNTAGKSGGALYVENDCLNSNINATFINNRAYNGGAIYFNGATSNMEINSYFKDNNAERAGGAIYAKGESRNNIFASEFYNSSADKASGGAIFFYKMAENNIFESIFRYNKGSYGAGIFFYNKANNNRFSSDFRYNVAQSCGGAIFFYNTTNNNNFSGYFINNSALGKIDDQNGNGGAITFKNTSSNSIFTCDFVNNYAALYGGGVNYRETPYNITFNSNFINNEAYVGGGINFFESFENVVFNGKFTDNSAGYGGAISVKNGVIENTSFEDNSAESGGAIYFDKNGAVFNCEFNNNFISDEYGDGGAIYFNNGGIVSNSSFTNNRANYYAGAVYFFGNGTVIDSNFNSNEAQNGGSVYIFGKGNIINSNFTNNRARTGGAIEFWRNATVINSNFNDNAARFSGGALYCNDALNITGSFFSKNSAGEYAGGAVYVFSKGEIISCEFTNNTSLDKGGTIFFYDDGKITDTLVTYSKTKEGAIYFRKNGIIDDSNFTNNAAEDGGAVLAYGNLTIFNSRFENNSAILGTDHVSLKQHAAISMINVTPLSLEPYYIGYLTILNAPNVTYGETAIITVNVTDENHNPFNNGTVSCVIGDTLYSANVENGIAILAVENLNAGEYDVEVRYNGNGYVAISQAKFSVFKQNAVIAAAFKSYIINYGGKYSIILKDKNGSLLSGKTVQFTLNGKNIKSSLTNVKGVATISLTASILKNAKTGKKNLVIKFSDPNYNSISKTVKISINKEKTKIVSKNKNFLKSKKIKSYTISLKNSKGKAVKKVSVTLKVKGKTYKARTNSKGQATFKITKLTNTGKFKASIKFAGSKYYKPVSKIVRITVK